MASPSVFFCLSFCISILCKHLFENDWTAYNNNCKCGSKSDHNISVAPRWNENQIKVVHVSYSRTNITQIVWWCHLQMFTVDILKIWLKSSDLPAVCLLLFPPVSTSQTSAPSQIYMKHSLHHIFLLSVFLLHLPSVFLTSSITSVHSHSSFSFTQSHPPNSLLLLPHSTSPHPSLSHCLYSFWHAYVRGLVVKSITIALHWLYLASWGSGKVPVQSCSDLRPYALWNYGAVAHLIGHVV